MTPTYHHEGDIVEPIITDTDTDGSVDAPADEPVVEQDAPVADEPASEPDPGSADDAAEPDAEQDAGISGEQARKLRSEASNLRTRLREAEGNAEGLRAELKERDQALSQARSELLDAMIRERATGKLMNPADALMFVDRSALAVDDVDGIDAAITGLLEERAYLANTPSIPQVDQGVQRERPRGKSFSDVMAEGLGWSG